LIEWYFEPESPLGGISGAGCRNALEGVGLSRDQKIVRETLQNSADALAPGSQRSKVIFRLVDIVGNEKSEFLNCSGLGKMLMQRGDKLDLPADFDPSGFLNDELPLSLLYIEDFGTTGLRGDEHSKGVNSDFFRFVYLYGDEEKATAGDLSLGSYGLGKSVLSSASPVFAFFVHTVVDPLTSNGTYSRTIGCGLYKTHEFESKNYGGRAWFGETSDNAVAAVSALKDDQAVDFASELGFIERGQSDTGTSICIVGLKASAEDYVDAVCMYWWPRLVKQELVVEVIDQDGLRHIPKPRQHPKLKKYIEAFELATGTDQSKDENSKRQEFRKTHVGRSTGVLAAKRGIPLESNEELHLLDNKVALLRQKGMVVDYLPVSTTSNQRWFSVFLADPESDDLLKLSEPAAHNKWDAGSTRLANKYGVEGKKVVDTIHQRIASNIRTWFGASKATHQQANQRVRRLDELFGRLFSSPGDRQPKPEPNPAPVHLDHLEEFWHETGDRAWITASPMLRLKNEVELEVIRVSIKTTCRICEDIELKPGEGINVRAKIDGVTLVPAIDGSFELELQKNTPIRLDLESEEFDSRLLVDWRVEVMPK